MPFLECNNASLYYEETGSGESIIAVHGFSVNSSYWSRTGVTDRLAEYYRVISMDMRGHGRTRVEGEPSGFNATTVGDDIAALADALGIARFHLLGHSTGGMVAVRYAMRHGARLLSLILIGTGSATVLGPGDPRIRRQAMDLFAGLYEHYRWDQIFAHLRNVPGPLLYRMDQFPDRERLWGMLEAISRLNDPKLLATFVRSFYSDPDPRVEGLRRILCPALVMLGEHDKLFIKPSELMAREISGAKQVVMEGIGHMTALEDPDRTSREIVAFLQTLG